MSNNNSETKIKKVVLAYSGGLDTSVIIPWLKDQYNCEVIAMVADLGQEDELSGLEERALAAGASKYYCEDLREEFITDFIFPTLKAGAVYESKYLLGTSFARPLISKRQVEIAKIEGADAVCHGATGKGNDQVRFELTYMALNPDLKIIAPWREPSWKIESREDAIDYAKAKNIPLTVSKDKIYSEDRNLWHISHEGGELEDPAATPLDRVYTISNTPEKAPEEAGHLELEFEKGIPLKLDGRKLKPIEMMDALNKIGARHAIGQIDIVENRLVGMKSRGVYETPGGTLLYFAHEQLESLTLDRDLYHYKELIAKQYADLVYDGKWYCSLRECLDAFVDKSQERVTGKVRLKLYKGNMIPQGIESPFSLYSEKMASFADDRQFYHQEDAKGFIRLFGLPLRTKGNLDRSLK